MIRVALFLALLGLAFAQPATADVRGKASVIKSAVIAVNQPRTQLQLSNVRRLKPIVYSY